MVVPDSDHRLIEMKSWRVDWSSCCNEGRFSWIVCLFESAQVKLDGLAGQINTENVAVDAHFQAELSSKLTGKHRRHSAALVKQYSPKRVATS